ncbi:MAG: MFS transporter [Verrucomicrobia bacterium]|nr:MFS transporter [Verrucomicrobiota bacterium]
MTKKRPQHRSRLMANFRRESVAMLTVSFAVALVESDFAGILADKIFAAPPFLLAIIAAAPAIAHLSSMHWAHLAQGRPKIAISVRLYAGVLLAVAAIAVLPVSQMGAWALAALVLAARILYTGVFTIRTSIWHLNYPRPLRARISGRLNMIYQVVMGIMTLFAAGVFDAYHEGFRVIYPASAVVGIIGIIAVRRVLMHREAEHLEHEVEHDAETSAGRSQGSLGRLVAALRRDPLYRRMMIAQFALGTSALMTTPVMIHLISRVHGYSYMLSAVIIVGIPWICSLCVMPAWSAYLDRVHVARFRSLQSLIWLACHVVTLAGFVTWSVELIVLGRILRGAAWRGGLIAYQLGHLDFARRGEATFYMGINATLTGVRGALAPILGMALYLGWPSVTLPGVVLPGFSGMGPHVFLVAALLSAAAGAMYLDLYRRVRQGPRATPPHPS